MSGLVNFSNGHTSPVLFFSHGTFSQPVRIKGKGGEELSLIECVTLTNVYNREAF